MTETGSRKIDALIALARDAGLTVEVEVEDTPWCGTDTYRNVSVQIARVPVEVQNALDLVNNGERIWLGWGWPRTCGRTPKLCYATKTGTFGCERKLTAKMISYAIQGMTG